MRNQRSTSNRSRAFAACLAGALLGACAGTPENIAPPAAPSGDKASVEGGLSTTAALTESDVQCQNERVTGSHMIKTVCTTAEQRRDMEDAAKQWMRTGGRSGGVSRVRDDADPRDTDEKD